VREPSMSPRRPNRPSPNAGGQYHADSPGTRAPGSNRIAQHTAAAFVNAIAHSSPARRGGSSTALGIVLVVIGLFALLIVLSGVDLTEAAGRSSSSSRASP